MRRSRAPVENQEMRACARTTAPNDQRRRLSLAGVQRKAVLVRDLDGRYGEPLNGMPSTHVLKPQRADDFPDIAVNELFCLRLAARRGLAAANVALITAARRLCLVVERNISLLHEQGGGRMAPLYEVVCTGVYAGMNRELALVIGDELDPEKVDGGDWSDLANDLELNPRAFERVRADLARLVPARVAGLREQARAAGWHRPILDEIVEMTRRRARQL